MNQVPVLETLWQVRAMECRCLQVAPVKPESLVRPFRCVAEELELPEDPHSDGEPSRASALKGKTDSGSDSAWLRGLK